MAKKLFEQQNLVEITKESGEVIITEKFQEEISAHNQFEKLEEIRYPMTYQGLTMNLSEYFTGGTIGSVRVVVINSKGDRFTRRELWRTA